jgi:hypothetical protein
LPTVTPAVLIPTIFYYPLVEGQKAIDSPNLLEIHKPFFKIILMAIDSLKVIEKSRYLPQPLWHATLVPLPDPIFQLGQAVFRCSLKVYGQYRFTLMSIVTRISRRYLGISIVF